MPEDSPARPITLPPEVATDLADLIRNRKQIAAVVTAATDVAPAASVRGFSSRVAQSSDVDATKAFDILHALSNIRRMQRAREVDAGRMVEILSVSLEKYAPDHWKKAYLADWKEASQDVIDAIERIDEDHPLFVSEKAETLAYSHQNIVTSQRIVTDLRPVFDKEAGRIQELIISHTLLIEYFDGVSPPRRVAFALDSADIAELRGLCERAERKAKTAVGAMGEFNVVELPEDLGEERQS